MLTIHYHTVLHRLGSSNTHESLKRNFIYKPKRRAPEYIHVVLGTATLLALLVRLESYRLLQLSITTALNVERSIDSGMFLALQRIAESVARTNIYIFLSLSSPY